MTNKPYFIFIGLVLCLLFLVYALSGIHVTYYASLDIFGVLSQNFQYALISSFLIVVLLIGIRKKEKRIFLVLLPIFLLIIFKYCLPDALETSYVTSFYDSVGHLRRGLFVTNTGFSDIQVDNYFDSQPGFFWFSSILLNVVNGPGLSLINSLSIFILKWFSVFMICGYLSVLILFYKSQFQNLSVVGFALVLQFALDLQHFHYASQSFSNLLYWLFLAIMLSYITKKDKFVIYLALILGTILIFVHQGMMLFVVVTLVAMLCGPFLFSTLELKSRQRFLLSYSKRLLFLLVAVISCWFIYLLYASHGIFGDFLTIARNSIINVLFDNTALVTSGMTRAYPLMSDLVKYKVMYIGIILLSGLIFSFINARKTKTTFDRTVFSIQLFITIVIGAIAINLGGAGYVERLLILLPLTVCSIIRFVMIQKCQFNSFKYSSTIIRILAGLLIICIILSGFIFYFSGRNFQSITRSELYEINYSITYSNTNFGGVYASTPIVAVSNLFKNSNLLPGTVYSISPHDSNQASLYITGDFSVTSSLEENMIATANRIYDNEITQLVSPVG